MLGSLCDGILIFEENFRSLGVDFYLLELVLGEYYF